MSDNNTTIEISDPRALPEKPLVSVYMLAYRHEKFIAEAIEGVVEQRCNFPIELIIGEDCSPDNTRAIVLDYQRWYPYLIRVLTSKRNIGAGANTARCRAATRGQFIAVCEGDDYWCNPGKLSMQVAHFEANPDHVLICHPAYRVDAQSGRRLGVVRPTFSSRLLSMRELILGDGGLIPTASILFRRDILKCQPPWVRSSPIGDYPLVLCAGMAGNVANLNTIMAVYRVNAMNSWSTLRGDYFAPRWDHAVRISTMLAGFNRQTQGRYQSEVKIMTSKYFSDAIVRFRGERNMKKSRFLEVSDQLTVSDRFFCEMKLYSRTPSAAMKTLHRKVGTLVRILTHEIMMPHL